jgi:hypothetical protein
MKTNLIFTPILLLTLFSCEMTNQSFDNYSKIPPKIPNAVKYDLNDDSVDDINIDYRSFTWDGINCAGNGISGVIEPLNQCSILLKYNEYILFNELNDTIRVNTNEPYYWEKYLSSDMVSISSSSFNDYLWQNEWRIHSNKTMDYYYLGIKIANENINMIGWIKMKIDKSTGVIKILNKKFSTEEYIVIGK